MKLPLVVGIDGSESSLRATDWAAAYAARHGLVLRLVHVSVRESHEGSVSPVEDRSSPHVDADLLVHDAAERAWRSKPDVESTTEVLYADPVQALLREGRHATALVTGSRGRVEITELLLGSVGLAVAARAECPVIVVRGAAFSRQGRHERILLGVGNSPAADAVVRFAFEEAEARRCELHAVRAWRRPAVEGASHPRLTAQSVHFHQEQASTLLDEAVREASIDHPGVVVHRATPERTARKALLRRSAAADLLVVGATRRHGHIGLQLGRVAHAVLHHAQCPVAVVPHLG
ncbi:universal stress protein [Streptomyces sp. NPDC055099]